MYYYYSLLYTVFIARTMLFQLVSEIFSVSCARVSQIIRNEIILIKKSVRIIVFNSLIIENKTILF